jgi:hypothetical protein
VLKHTMSSIATLSLILNKIATCSRISDINCSTVRLPSYVELGLCRNGWVTDSSTELRYANQSLSG